MWGYITDEAENYDSYKSPGEYLLSYGYSFEEHKVLTEDGYILTLWRIPGKLGSRPPKTPKTPVVLIHGLLDNGFSYLLKSIDKNLGIILIKEGYDVWIGNSRGNIRSKEHINPHNYSWKDPRGKFWDFSLDEMAEYDVPSICDYITGITDRKLVWIGHSQGASQFLIAGAQNPEYINRRVSRFIGLAPILYLENMPGEFERIFSEMGLSELLYKLGIKSIMVWPMFSHLQSYLCKLVPSLLYKVIPVITGRTSEMNFDLNRFGVAGANEPGGTSIQNLEHWVQIMKFGVVRKFDYGETGNLQKYATSYPPYYPLANLAHLSMPLQLFMADTDNVMSEIDFGRLVGLFTGRVQVEYVTDFGHLDYLWADSADLRVYTKITRFLEAT